jgi:hypothetical protein
VPHCFRAVEWPPGKNGRGETERRCSPAGCPASVPWSRAAIQDIMPYRGETLPVPGSPRVWCCGASGTMLVRASFTFRRLPDRPLVVPARPFASCARRSARWSRHLAPMPVAAADHDTHTGGPGARRKLKVQGGNSARRRPPPISTFRSEPGQVAFRCPNGCQWLLVLAVALHRRPPTGRSAPK